MSMSRIVGSLTSLRYFPVFLCCLLLLACGGGGGGNDGTAGTSLSRIEVTPSQPSLAAGTTLTLVATGINSDNSTSTLSTSVTWQSSDNTIATISASGEVNALAAGQVTILATLGAISGSTTLTVTSASLSSLEISPPSLQLANGTSGKLTLIGHYSDGSTQDLTDQASWTLADTAIASLSASARVTGLSVGNTQLTASMGGISTQIGVTITAAELTQITLNPEAPNLPLGTQLSLTALGLYSDGSSQDLSDQVNWNSADTGIVDIDAKGLVQPQGIGSTNVSASLAGISRTLTITVSSAILNSIEISAANDSLPLGQQQALRALGHYSDGTLQDISEQVTWQSSPPSTLAIDNASGKRGLATALAVGSATATATLGAVSGSLELIVSPATLTSIDISPPDARLALGTQTTFLANGYYSDGTVRDISTLVSWSTANPGLAAISNATDEHGLANALGVGATSVTATLYGISASASLTVSSAQLLSINVQPGELNLFPGANQDVHAEGSFSDGSVQMLDEQVLWESDNLSIATVNGGSVNALTPGVARISASLGSISGNATVSVSNATLSSLQITPDTPSLVVGTQLQLRAIATYSDGSQKDVTTQVTWSSADEALLRALNGDGQQGLLVALASGATTVTALLDGMQDSTPINIATASLVSLSISSSKTILDSAEQQQLTLTGTFSDGSSQDLTQQAAWRSATPTLAFVDNQPTQRGLVTAGIGVTGNVSITANYAGLSATLDLTINNTPQRPVSLVVLANPNVLLNDGADSSTLEVRVRAADPNATVADGTVINLEIRQNGTLISSQNLVTSGGIANTSFTTTQNGLLQISASVDAGTIHNSTFLYSSATIYDVIAGGAFADAKTSGTTVLSGSRFGLFLFNLSNRDFPLTQYELLNGSDILFSTTDPANLNGNVLSGGLKMGIIAILPADITDKGIKAHFDLLDPASGKAFALSVVYSTP